MADSVGPARASAKHADTALGEPTGVLGRHVRARLPDEPRGFGE